MTNVEIYFIAFISVHSLLLKEIL